MIIAAFLIVAIAAYMVGAGLTAYVLRKDGWPEDDAVFMSLCFWYIVLPIAFVYWCAQR